VKERIKERRKYLGLTLQAVADLVGTSKSYVWELENNDLIEPSARKLESFAQALDTTTRYLLTGSLQGTDGIALHNAYMLMSDVNKILITNMAKQVLKAQK